MAAAIPDISYWGGGRWPIREKRRCLTHGRVSENAARAFFDQALAFCSTMGGLCAALLIVCLLWCNRDFRDAWAGVSGGRSDMLDGRAFRAKALTPALSAIRCVAGAFYFAYLANACGHDCYGRRADRARFADRHSCARELPRSDWRGLFRWVFNGWTTGRGARFFARNRHAADVVGWSPDHGRKTEFLNKLKRGLFRGGWRCGADDVVLGATALRCRRLPYLKRPWLYCVT